MHVNRTSTWLKRIALLLVFSVTSSSTLAAQTVRADIASADAAARTVDMPTDATHAIRASASAEVARLGTSGLLQGTRESDSVLNGALIGAGVAVGAGLVFCRAMEPWEVCNNPGPLLRIGAIGAGIGIGIDALIRKRRPSSEVPPGSARLHAAPILSRDRRELQLTFSF